MTERINNTAIFPVTQTLRELESQKIKKKKKEKDFSAEESSEKRNDNARKSIFEESELISISSGFKNEASSFW